MGFVRFQDLEVYQLAEELSDAVWKIVEKWNPLARDTVGKQLVRAADSVGANISEGAGRGSRLDNRRCMRIARGSFTEVQHWLRRAFVRNLLTLEQTETLQKTVTKLGPKLNAYLTSLGRVPADDRATDDRTQIQNAKHQTPNTKPDDRTQIQNTKHQTPNTKPDDRTQIQNTKHQTPNTKPDDRT